MNIPWHASRKEIAFLRCGSYCSNQGNGMRVFAIDQALVERMFKHGTSHRSWASMPGSREARLNRLNLWLRSHGLYTLIWGHRCEDCENE